jgi:hypothetical protein
MGSQEDSVYWKLSLEFSPGLPEYWVMLLKLDYLRFGGMAATLQTGLPDGVFCRIFKTKIPIWVNLGGPWNGKGWCILWTFGIYFGHLEYISAIWSFSGNLVYISPFWIIVPRKIWQPCLRRISFLIRNVLHLEN